MASLREMLEKQRQEKANAASKEIRAANLRTEAGEIRPEIPANGQAAKETQGTVSGPSELLGSKAEGNVSGNGSNGGQEIIAVPPAGLSGLALIRWKKENGKKEISTNNAPTTVGTISSEITTNQTRVPENQAQTQSIGHREAEKTNDGNIEVQQLKDQLVYLANNIDQKEIVAQIVRTIATQLKQNPSLTPFMKKSDVDLVVRGVRMSYQVAARKKTEKAETKTKKSAMDSELGQMFKAAGLSDLAAKLGG